MSESTAEKIAALVDRGAIEDATAMLGEALPSARGADRAYLLMARCVIDTNRGEYIKALGACMEATELFEQARQPLGMCDALLRGSTTLRGAGDVDAALDMLEQAETLARTHGDALRVARAQRHIGILSSMLGRHQQAVSCLEESWSVLTSLAPPDEMRWTRLSLLNAYSRQIDDRNATDAAGALDLQAHLDDWRALAEDARAAGQTRLELMALGNHAIVQQAAGRPRESAAELNDLLPRYRSLSMRPNEGLAHAELGRCHEALGDPERACHHFEQACRLLREGGVQNDLLQALEGAARAHEARGDVGAALAALKELRALERQRKDDAARQALVQRDLRIELARLTSQWARQAIQDPLTGLANRRGLERWMSEHWPRAERGEPLAVVLLDLDHFKRINDTLGHDTGDVVLKETANLLRTQCRSTDLAVRYGGEEFLLAMGSSTLDGAAQRAEQLRALVHQQPWSRVAPGLEVSASFGVADASEALEVGALLTLADRRLYAAKFGGRNRVVAAG